MQMHKQSTWFDPSLYISKNATNCQKVVHKKAKLRVQNLPQYKENVKSWRLGGGEDKEVVDKKFNFRIEVIIKTIQAFRTYVFVIDSLYNINEMQNMSSIKYLCLWRYKSGCSKRASSVISWAELNPFLYIY